MLKNQKMRKGRSWQMAVFLLMFSILQMAFSIKSESRFFENKLIRQRYLVLQPVPENQLVENKNKELNQLDTLISGKRLIIKDTTVYDSSFIRGLKSNLGYETIQVFGDSFLYTYRPNTKPDTLITFEYTIPTNLEQNKEIRFTATIENLPYVLILKRTNYTNIEYQLRQAEKVIKSGTAILQSSFYFGAETQGDEKGRTIYLRQYIDNERCGAVLKVEIDHGKIATISWCDEGSPEKYRHLPIFRR